MTAEAPGRGIISILFLIHSLINIAPGSEIVGVPASDIKETNDPLLINSIIYSSILTRILLKIN